MTTASKWDVLAQSMQTAPTVASKAGRRDLPPATMFANLVVVDLVEGKPQVVARLMSLALDHIRETQSEFGTQAQRETTLAIHLDWLAAAEALEPGSTAVYGTTNGELEPGLRIQLSRARGKTLPTDEQKAQVVASVRDLFGK